MKTRLFYLFALLPCITTTAAALIVVHPAAAPSISSSYYPLGAPPPPLKATSISATSTATTTTDYRIDKVQSDADVLNVASFRNGLVNPAMMVQQQQEKRDSLDKPKAALDGLLIGLGIIGPILGGLDYMQSHSLQEALSIYAVTGGGIGALLAVNNFMGRKVYVMTEAEATNRLLVDYAENLKRKADVGFVAISDNVKYAPVGGVMGVADVQLRNSPQSPAAALKVTGLPSHLHLKNMEVDPDMRRKGVGRALLQAITEYAQVETDAKQITLIVEDKNEAAIRLYESEGFEFTKTQKMMLGRQFMTKQL